MGATRFHLADSLGYLVNRVAAKMRLAFERELSEHGATTQQWAAMAALAERGSAPIADIAAELGIDFGATSRLVVRLEEKGLVERAAARADARVTLLSLSAKGKHLLPQLTAAARRVNAQFEEQLGEDAQRFLNALRTLNEVELPR